MSKLASPEGHVAALAPARILVLDDEPLIQKVTRRLLEREGMLVDCAGSIPDAVSMLSGKLYDVAIVDIFISRDQNGLDFLATLRRQQQHTQVILITGQPEVETASRAVRLGAYDYLAKPIAPPQMITAVSHAIAHKRLLEENERQRTSLQAVFRSVTDGIVHVDSQARLLQFNRAASQMCGYSEAAVFRPLAETDNGCGGICRKTMCEVLADGVQRSLKRFPCENRLNVQRLISIIVTPTLSDSGEITGAVAVMRDETDLAALETRVVGQSEYAGIIGKSSRMQRMFNLIQALADVQTTVLIEGESGTGKELVAAALHKEGARRNKPFVRVNCAALPEQLLESELFGHVRGAFTGAVSARQGRFEMADGGTIFLDEIGDISPAMQMRLLRVLQEQEFEKVGDSRTIKVDVRVIAATNRDLAAKVRQGEFRQDLYYRLNVVKLVIPPLRERPEDIPLLIRHFLDLFARKFNRPPVSIDHGALQRLLAYPWPGNVRELEHAVEHAVLMCQSGTISAELLPDDLLVTQPETLRQMAAVPPLSIDEALAKAGGNKAKAARMLGISRMTLYRHLGEEPLQ